MTIISQTVWFDEPPGSLERMIRSINGLVDHATFLDGPYKLFPHASPRSDQSQYDAIIETCNELGIPHTIIDGRVYPSQASKRTASFDVVSSIGTVFEDYSFVIDADEFVEDPTHFDRVRSSLHEQRTDIGLVTVNTPGYGRANSGLLGINQPRNSTDRHGNGASRIFRLHRGTYVDPQTHWNYIGFNERGDEVRLRGSKRTRTHVDAVESDYSDLIRITNETWKRDPKRIAAKHSYGKHRKRARQDL